MGPDSNLGIDLHQRWTFYPDSGSSTNQASEVDFYDFMVRYDWRPVRNLDWGVEGGYQIQRGQGMNQDLFVARTFVKWLVGKLDIHIGYEYQNQKYTAQRRDRNFVYLRATRTF
jgi:outer membrane protease